MENLELSLLITPNNQKLLMASKDSKILLFSNLNM